MSINSKGKFKEKIDKNLMEAFRELAREAQGAALEEVKRRFPGYIDALEYQDAYEEQLTEQFNRQLEGTR